MQVGPATLLAAYAAFVNHEGTKTQSHKEIWVSVF